MMKNMYMSLYRRYVHNFMLVTTQSSAARLSPALSNPKFIHPEFKIGTRSDQAYLPRGIFNVKEEAIKGFGNGPIAPATRRISLIPVPPIGKPSYYRDTFRYAALHDAYTLPGLSVEKPPEGFSDFNILVPSLVPRLTFIPPPAGPLPPIVREMLYHVESFTYEPNVTLFIDDVVRDATAVNRTTRPVALALPVESIAANVPEWRGISGNDAMSKMLSNMPKGPLTMAPPPTPVDEALLKDLDEDGVAAYTDGAIDRALRTMAHSALVRGVVYASLYANVQWYALMVPLRFASAFAARLAARDGVKLDDDSLEMHPVEPVDMQDLRTNPRARRFFDEEDNKEKDNKEKDAKEKDMDAAEKDSSKDSKESKEKEKDGSKEAKDGASSSDKGKDGKKE